MNGGGISGSTLAGLLVGAIGTDVRVLGGGTAATIAWNPPVARKSEGRNQETYD